MQAYNGILASPIGPLGVRYQNQTLIGIEFLPKTTTCFAPHSDLFWQDVSKELNAYFKDPKHRFTLPYTIAKGTAFHQRVWQAISNIPLSETVTYSDIAQTLTTSARAVGNACRRNPVPLIIPCHRIVGKQGLGGFSGARGGEL